MRLGFFTTRLSYMVSKDDIFWTHRRSEYVLAKSLKIV